MRGFLILLIFSISSASQEEKKPDDKQRLGLIASSLGIPPVPGYESGAEVQHGQPLSSGQYPEGNDGPGGGFQGGNGGLIGGNGQGGGFQGGNGQGGGFQGGNGPCQCLPIEQCSSSGSGGGGGGGDGYQGGNLPIIGGGIKNPGYPGGDSGANQPNDGSGVIDIRIVNRAPGSGGVQCSPGQIFCCGKNQDGDSAGGYDGCGKRKIINVPNWTPEYGQAQFGAYPWMAVVLGKGNNYIGAGALLDGYHVLTAAHKVQSWKPGTYMKVRLGEWNAKDDTEPHKNVEIDIENVEIHPEFNPVNLYNDIAVIKLSQPIDVNAYPHIKSACLPKGFTNDYVGRRCWVAGFGKDAFGNGKHSYIMKEVDLPILETRACENLLRGTRLGKNFYLDTKSFICAGGEEGKDACSGDGGSPLVCQINGNWNVVGLVAWGIGCADYAVPGVYVNVPNYLPWIESVINNYGQNKGPVY